MINSFHDFVGGPIGGGTSGSDGPRPYIYVIEYILTKDDYEKELKDYIINYKDKDDDYEDEESQDSFMKKLKMLAAEDEFSEIEDLIYSYDPTAGVDYDEDDDDFELKMYNPDYNEDLENINLEDLQSEVENSDLSDGLKDFLKVDLKFEDLFEDDDEYIDSIESDEDEFIDNELAQEDFEDIVDADFEEIIDDDSDETILPTSGVEGVLSDTPTFGNLGISGTSGTHTEDCPACKPGKIKDKNDHIET